MTRPVDTEPTNDPEPNGPEQNGPEPNGPERIGPERIGPERIGPEQNGPQPAEMVSDLLEEVDTPFGLYRLSPRETQVAILTAEGLSADDLAVGLGIKVGTVRNIRQALRRKLDVPPQLPLNEALSGLFGTIPKNDGADRPLAGIDDGPEPARERRVHLSVRQAISSVGELAERLEARSEAVAAAAQQSRKSHDRLLWEADQLKSIANDLHGLEAEAVARVRAHLALVGRAG